VYRDADDPLPGVFDAARTLFHFAAHPRSTYRQADQANAETAASKRAR
jgi:hypothetical protein